MLTATTCTTGFRTLGHVVLRRLAGVMLVGLILLDTLTIGQAASVSQKLDEPTNHIKVNAFDVGSQLGLRKLILLHKQTYGRVAMERKMNRERNLPSGTFSQIPGSGKGRGSGSGGVGSGGRGHEFEPKVRMKRWDFRMDGCHCDGYTIECMHDYQCQRRNKSHYWKCSHTCCGFQCVPLLHGQQQQQHRNVTRRPSRNSTHTAQNVTRPTKPVLSVIRPSRTALNVTRPTKTVLNAIRPTKPALSVIHPSRTVLNATRPTKTALNAIRPTKTVLNAIRPARTALNMTHPAKIQTQTQSQAQIQNKNTNSTVTLHQISSATNAKSSGSR